MKTLQAVVVTAMLATTASANDSVTLLADAAARSNAGDHAAAIALYEQAYLAEPDPALLPIIGAEYRRAGLPLDAMSFFCDYVTALPKGPQAAFATSQVIAIRAELRLPKDRICEKAAPIRVDFVTPRRAPRTKPGMSKRELAGLATAAAGLASLGASLYYTSRASAISSDISNHDPARPWSADIHELQARGERFEDRAQLFALAGGAALITAGVLYFTGRADRLSSETIVAPTVTSAGGGISFTRGF